MTHFQVSLEFPFEARRSREASCVIGDTKYVSLTPFHKDLCISLDRGRRAAATLRGTTALSESNDRKS